jgi:hypothetical protein
MVQTTFQVVAMKAVGGPVLVFTQQREKELAVKLAEIYSGTVGFVYICDDKKAEKIRLKKSKSEHEVFVFNPAYARGFDLKEARDVYFLIPTF